ncbi:MAG: carboxylating nicotinate-nucleotide diphosphorylase [Fimbriimonadaceae bacterium]|nr:carboxylating nicotinate-nucleotide diphosphorylase [Fimbriimonadaceae bacterium]
MSIWLQPEPLSWWHNVDDAIQEDVGSGDLSGGCIDPELMSSYYIEAQAEGTVCGLGIAEYLLAPYPTDPDGVKIDIGFKDGDRVSRGDILVSGRTSARRALLAERTVLNFMMHLSGVATFTRKFVDQAGESNVRIVDTRKTLPGLRALQKYAVRCGGGHSHRMGLFDGVMIKDNHIRACGSIKEAVEKVKEYAPHTVRIEVECTSLEQVAEAVDAGADIVMLDNMDPFMMREAVKDYRGKVIFEASGGISLDTVRGMAQTGVDIISIGALTHSAPALAMHMEFE